MEAVKPGVWIQHLDRYESIVVNTNANTVTRVGIRGVIVCNHSEEPRLSEVEHTINVINKQISNER